MVSVCGIFFGVVLSSEFNTTSCVLSVPHSIFGKVGLRAEKQFKPS